MENEELDELYEEKKKPSLLKRLLLWIIVPLLFISAILLIVAKVADINVIDQAKKMITSESSEKEGVLDKNAIASQEKLVELQAAMQQKDSDLKKIQHQLATAKEENELLLIEQEKLQMEIEKLVQNQAETKKEFTEIVSTFEKMSAKAAAPILIEMNEVEALKILSQLKPDTVAKILEKMEPTAAAKFATLLSK